MTTRSFIPSGGWNSPQHDVDWCPTAGGGPRSRARVVGSIRKSVRGPQSRSQRFRQHWGGSPWRRQQPSQPGHGRAKRGRPGLRAGLVRVGAAGDHRLLQCGRAGAGGMRIRTTGRAGQRQARSLRSCGLNQSAWLPGGVPAIWSPRGTFRRPWPCGAETSSSVDQPQTAASRLSRDLAIAPGGIFGPEHPGGPPCDRRPGRING
jgi:hypothetical protein